MWPGWLWGHQLSSQGVGWALLPSLWENGGGLWRGVRGPSHVPGAGDQIPALALGCKKGFLQITLYFIHVIQEVLELWSKGCPSRAPITTLRGCNHPPFTHEETGVQRGEGAWPHSRAGAHRSPWLRGCFDLVGPGLPAVQPSPTRPWSSGARQGTRGRRAQCTSKVWRFEHCRHADAAFVSFLSARGRPALQRPPPHPRCCDGDHNVMQKGKLGDFLIACN